MEIAAIVPALNEAGRIGAVIEALQETEGLSEIIVVDDGSTDDTLRQVPSGNGFRSLRLNRNYGKGAALLAGARASRAKVLVFVDADLVGLKCHHIESLLAPIAKEEAEMSIAVFQRGRWHIDIGQRLAPYISGQRALFRDFFLSLPNLEKVRFGIETAVSREARLRGLRVKKVPWEGVSHVMKEEKLGLARGLLARMKMYWEIGAYLYSADGHKRPTPVSSRSAPVFSQEKATETSRASEK